MTDADARRPVIWVLEPTPDWEPELLRQLPGCDVRALAALERRADAGERPPELIVAVGEAAVAHLRNAPHWRGTTAVVGILEYCPADREFALRELGVMSLYSRSDHREQIVAACRRLLRPVLAASGA